MPTSKEKKQQTKWGKEQLIDEIFERIKEKNKITKLQLKEIIEVSLQTIKLALKNDFKVALKGHFSLFVAISKETLKNNPRDRQQKLLIPAQKRVRIRISDDWKKSLNPLMKVTEDLNQAKEINDLEMIYKAICGQEIYQANKKRIDDVYNDCLSSLQVAGRK